MKDIVFVSGVARSGTSALVNVLNSHPKFLIGMERYFFRIRRENITKDHFRKSRFLDIQDGDTHAKNLQTSNLDVAFSNATYVGDKFPLLFENFDYIFQEFPDAKHIYIVRNPLSVAESYDTRFNDDTDKWKKSFEDGLRDWNNSIKTLMALPKKRLSNFFLVQYEDFFSHPDQMNGLFKAFGLNELPDAKLTPFSEKFASLNARQVERRDDIRVLVSRQAAWTEYTQLLDLIDQQNSKSSSNTIVRKTKAQTQSASN